MKKILMYITLGVLFISLTNFGCGGKQEKQDDIFNDEETVTPPSPVQHADTGTGAAQSNQQLITDDTQQQQQQQSDDQMTDSGFTVGEEKIITLMVAVLEKDAGSYTAVTSRLQSNRYFRLFVAKKYTAPLNNFTFWWRWKASPERAQEARTQLGEWYKWRIENDENERFGKTGKKWYLLLEAGQRAKPSFEAKALD